MTKQAEARLEQTHGHESLQASPEGVEEILDLAADMELRKRKARSLKDRTALEIAQERDMLNMGIMTIEKVLDTAFPDKGPDYWTLRLQDKVAEKVAALYATADAQAEVDRLDEIDGSLGTGNDKFVDAVVE
jgi:hypothetical protein